MPNVTNFLENISSILTISLFGLLEQMGVSLKDSKLNINSVIATLEGIGSNGYDDGTGTSASFSFSKGITTDGTNLYLSDKGNQLILKID